RIPFRRQPRINRRALLPCTRPACRLSPARRSPERHSSAEHVAGKGVVPAFRFTRSTAAHLGAFVHFTDKRMRGSDRPSERLVADGVAPCVVWGEKSVTTVEQMRRATRGSCQYRREGEGARLSLAVRGKGGFRHIAGDDRIAHEMDAGLQRRLERSGITRAPPRTLSATHR